MDKIAIFEDDEYKNEFLRECSRYKRYLNKLYKKSREINEIKSVDIMSKLLMDSFNDENKCSDFKFAKNLFKFCIEEKKKDEKQYLYDLKELLDEVIQDDKNDDMFKFINDNIHDYFSYRNINKYIVDFIRKNSLEGDLKDIENILENIEPKYPLTNKTKYELENKIKNNNNIKEKLNSIISNYILKYITNDYYQDVSLWKSVV